MFGNALRGGMENHGPRCAGSASSVGGEAWRRHSRRRRRRWVVVVVVAAQRRVMLRRRKPTADPAPPPAAKSPAPRKPKRGKQLSKSYYGQCAANQADCPWGHVHMCTNCFKYGQGVHQCRAPQKKIGERSQGGPWTEPRGAPSHIMFSRSRGRQKICLGRSVIVPRRAPSEATCAVPRVRAHQFSL